MIAGVKKPKAPPPKTQKRHGLRKPLLGILGLGFLSEGLVSSGAEPSWKIAFTMLGLLLGATGLGGATFGSNNLRPEGPRPQAEPQVENLA